MRKLPSRLVPTQVHIASACKRGQCGTIRVVHSLPSCSSQFLTPSDIATCSFARALHKIGESLASGFQAPSNPLWAQSETSAKVHYPGSMPCGTTNLAGGVCTTPYQVHRTSPRRKPACGARLSHKESALSRRKDPLYLCSPGAQRHAVSCGAQQLSVIGLK